MTKNETRQLLTILKTAYPLTYRNMSDDEMADTAALYHNCFRDLPAEAVAMALNEYVNNNEQPPTIAGIKRYLKRLDPDEDYETMFKELWSAICGNRKFEDLCPANRKYIGSQQTLDMMGLDEHTLMDVVKGQYMKRIPEVVERMKFEKKATDQLGEEKVNTLKAILSGHRKTDELPEYTIGELARRNG